MGFWSVAAPIAGSVIGGILNRRDKPKPPPPSAEYQWQQRNTPEILNYLRDQGRSLSDSPYGLGDVKQRLMTTARDTSTASYASQQAEIDRQAKLAGLSPAGGSADRMRYYAGEQQAQGLNQAYTGIELQDFLAKEEQRNRGLNLMLAISKSNPALAQIASHDYWNQLAYQQRDEDQINNLIGAITGGITEWDKDRGYNDTGGGKIWDRPAYGGGPTQPAEEIPYGRSYSYTNPYADSGWSF